MKAGSGRLVSGRGQTSQWCFWLATGWLVVFLASPAWARLGETYEECVARYGRPPAYTGGSDDYIAIQFMIFIKPPFQQIKIVFRDDRAAYIEYRQSGGMLFETIQTILDAHYETTGEFRFTEKDLQDNSGRAFGSCAWKSKKGYVGSFTGFGDGVLVLKEEDFDEYARNLAESGRQRTENAIREAEKAKLKGF